MRVRQSVSLLITRQKNDVTKSNTRPLNQQPKPSLVSPEHASAKIPVRLSVCLSVCHGMGSCKCPSWGHDVLACAQYEFLRAWARAALFCLPRVKAQDTVR